MLNFLWINLIILVKWMRNCTVNQHKKFFQENSYVVHIVPIKFLSFNRSLFLWRVEFCNLQFKLQASNESQSQELPDELIWFINFCTIALKEFWLKVLVGHAHTSVNQVISVQNLTRKIPTIYIFCSNKNYFGIGSQHRVAFV